MAASLGESVATKRHMDECRPCAHAPYRRCSLAIFISAQASKYSKLTAMELLAETKLFQGCIYDRKRL